MLQSTNVYLTKSQLEKLNSPRLARMKGEIYDEIFNISVNNLFRKLDLTHEELHKYFAYVCSNPLKYNSHAGGKLLAFEHYFVKNNYEINLPNQTENSENEPSTLQEFVSSTSYTKQNAIIILNILFSNLFGEKKLCDATPVELYKLFVHICFEVPAGKKSTWCLILLREICFLTGKFV